MSLILDALQRSGDDATHRARVIDELFNTDSFASPVGTFAIDDNGDTSLNRVAGYRIKGGKPVFAAPLTGEPSG